MVELTRGENIWLADADIPVSAHFHHGLTGLDMFALLLGKDGTAGSDHNLIFFNNPVSACGGVRLIEGSVLLTLTELPADIETVVIAAAFDDATPGTLGSCDGAVMSVRRNEKVLASHSLTGLSQERCLVLMEVYRREARWKLRTVSQGWVNGIVDLIESYGLVVEGTGAISEEITKPTVLVPDEFSGEPIGAGAQAWHKKRAGLPLSQFEELRASEYDAGMVRGVHFLKWSTEVARLKREGHLHEALSILLEILDATEQAQARERANAAARAALLRLPVEDVVVRETPPGWTENAAIVLRKLGDLEGEIAVIDRWLAHAGDPAIWVGATHTKLLARRGNALRLLERRNR